MSDSIKENKVRKRIELFAGLFIVIAIIFVLCLLIYWMFGVVSRLDNTMMAAILAASATVIASTVTVVVGKYFERRREIEAHFRERKADLYDECLKIIFDLLSGRRASNDELLTEELRDWQRRLILWSGSGTIQAYIAWIQRLKSGSVDAESVFLMDDLFKAIRKDLGLSSRGLRRGASAYLILREPELFLSLAQKDPNITLEEVSKLEKELANSVGKGTQAKADT